MRIAYISAGAAGMYCGSCLSDNALAAELKRQGHDVALIPTYTPMRTDAPDESIEQVFYGAVNVYLQDKLALFRHTPRFLDRILDQRWLLDRVSRLAGTTSARDLGALTTSVLEGENGHQRKELQRLTAWLRDDLRPEIVHLTNSMFLGFAAPLKRELGVSIVCSLQGEDLFLDQLDEPFRSGVRQLLRARSRDVDAFIATSRYYGEHMADYLGVEPERMHVVRLGIPVDDYPQAPGSDRDPVVIGYLARIAPEKGLHHLIEAFRIVAEELGPERVELRVAGYLGAGDQRYFAEQLRKLESWGLGSRFVHVGEVDLAGKVAFLAGLDVLSVPTDYREAKGRSVLEALASGVPVVQPGHGSFPEILEATGGGLIVPPGDPVSLARALSGLIGDPKQRRDLGRQGRAGVRQHYTAVGMAKSTLAVYGSLAK